MSPAPPVAAGVALTERVYAHDVNAPLLDLVPTDAHRVLDVGCGAGGNAASLRRRRPEVRVVGVTMSPAECTAAAAHLDSCVVADIEAGVPTALAGGPPFDALVFSHVLEHVREPGRVLAAFVPLVRVGGSVLLAVPNVVEWKTRWALARGRFVYTPTGVLDETHLRFFTYHTADRLLLAGSPGLELVTKVASGSAPTFGLRRLIGRRLAARLDAWASRAAPNFVGRQVVLVARRVF